MQKTLIVAGAFGIATIGLGIALPARAPGSSITTQETSSRAVVLFVGDMLFDRHIRLMMDKHGGDYIFSCLNGLFENADLVVGNLEGPITNEPSVSVDLDLNSPNNFRFTFRPETAQLLARHGIKVVSLGNNHISNFGLQGIDSTKNYLDEANVGYFGGSSKEETIYRTEVNGVPLSLISYNEFGGVSTKVVAEVVAAERTVGRVPIVYAHWGDEYTEEPPRVRATAKLLAVAGASAIIGSHPHVVLSSEYISAEKTLVYWSLGNFIFDQYWEPAVSHGLVVALTISPTEILNVTEYQVELLKDGRTCLLTK